MAGRRKISQIVVFLTILSFSISLFLLNNVYAGCENGTCPVSSGFAATIKVTTVSKPAPKSPARRVKIAGPNEPKKFATTKAHSGEKYKAKKGEIVSGNHKVTVKDVHRGDQRGQISHIRNIGGKDYALTKENQNKWSIKYDPKKDKTILTYKYKSNDEYIADWAAKNLEGVAKKPAEKEGVINKKATTDYDSDPADLIMGKPFNPSAELDFGGDTKDPFSYNPAERLGSLFNPDDYSRVTQKILNEIAVDAFAIVATTGDGKFLEKIDFVQKRTAGLKLIRDDAHYTVTIWGRDSKSNSFNSITDKISGSQLRGIVEYWSNH